MKPLMNAILAGLLMGAAHGVQAAPITHEDHNSLHSLGCLIVQDCKEDVHQIVTVDDIREVMPGVTFDFHEGEIENILWALHEMDVAVYIADDKYFPPNNRGVYVPAQNDLYLNMDWMKEPHYLLAVLRHEGWHAAQDCMAGTIDNSHVAVIHGDKTPWFWQETARRTYPEHVVPWEQEAMWAATQNGMTHHALLVCGNGRQPMWEAYEPTPMTREWLVNQGWIDE